MSPNNTFPSQPRLIFMGTPEFALPTLKALIAQHYEILAVVTQPDRPSEISARGCCPRRSTRCGCSPNRWPRIRHTQDACCPRAPLDHGDPDSHRSRRSARRRPTSPGCSPRGRRAVSRRRDLTMLPARLHARSGSFEGQWVCRHQLIGKLTMRARTVHRAESHLCRSRVVTCLTNLGRRAQELTRSNTPVCRL